MNTSSGRALRSSRLLILTPLILLACGSGSGETSEQVAANSAALGKLFCPAGTVAECTGATCVCVKELSDVTGTVTGLTGTGLQLLNDGTVIGVTQNGSVGFVMVADEVFDVTIRAQPSGQACVVTNGVGVAPGAPFQVACGAAYTIGGTITGLEPDTTAANGLSLLLQAPNVLGSSQVELTDGPYTFGTAVGSGQSYTVSVASQPPGQTCTVANGSGTVGNTSVTNVNVQCTTAAPTWTALANTSPAGVNAMWLMQDGTVLALETDRQTLMRLTPSTTGSYVQGTWSPAGRFLQPKAAFASQVLSNGKLVACGGEYTTSNSMAETNFCEEYDPIAQTSVQFAPPSGWTAIGDAPSTILFNGSMLIGNTQGLGTQAAILSPSLGWSIVGGDQDNEQGYALLQTGDVLTTNVYDTTSMRYSPGSAGFVEDATVPVVLGATINSSGEIGPPMTLANGQLIWFGSSGHTAIYTPTAAGQNGGWAAGPDFPQVSGDQLYSSDQEALLEPTGRVLVGVAGARTLTQIAEYDPTRNSISLLPGSPTGNNPAMLLLPTGEALISMGTAWYDVQFQGTVMSAPTITSFPGAVTPGTTVTLSGGQLCGLSEVSTEGDDNQQAEDYPLVRLSSGSTVQYLRAHDVTSRSIAPNAPASVSVDIPAGLAAGTYTLQVVAMGIPSAAVTVQVQ